MDRKTVLVIGAGLSGLGAARRALESNFSVTVVEKADQIGGIWYYKEDLNLTSVYEGVLTNQAKEFNQLPDFFFPQPDKWYFDSKEVQEYFVAYAKRHGVDKLIRFNQEVTEIRPAEKTKNQAGWQVTIKNYPDNGETIVEFYDFVAICSGHYACPKLPTIKGQELFKGKQIHSIAYRKADTFRGQRVLVIGSGVSSMDISFLLTKECSAVYYSQKTYFSLDFEMPPNLNICPLTSEITENGAVFTDGSSCDVDQIIYATGYSYSFPFLHPDCGITLEDDHIQHLWKHCINIKYPTMAMIGMPFMVLTMLLFDLQSQFVMKFWSGEKDFPLEDEMMKDSEGELQKRLDIGWPKRYAHKMSQYALEYHHDIADTAGLERTKVVFYKMARYFGPACSKDYLNYRKERYEIIDDENFRTYWTD